MSASIHLSWSQKITRWLSILVSSLLSLVLLQGLMSWLGSIQLQLRFSGHSGVAGWIVYLLLFVVFVLGIAVHEAGHWLGGRWAGFRSYAVVVLWFYLERKGMRWHFRVGAKPAKLWGFVQAMPLEFENYRQRQALFVAAGPGINLLTGSLALGLGWWWQPHVHLLVQPSLTVFWLCQSLLAFGAWSLMLGLTNLLPSSPRTDGSHLLALLRNGPGWRRQSALIRLISSTQQGTRPRDWDPELLRHTLACPDQSATECTIQLYAYAHALDRKDLEPAMLHLNQAIALRHLTQPAFQQHLCCEAAYCAAVLANEPENAERWLHHAERVQPLSEKAGAFARASVAYAQQDYATATGLLHHCFIELDETDSAGAKAQGLERLLELQQLIQSQQHVIKAVPTT
jgi:hypothetical protein